MSENVAVQDFVSAARSYCSLLEDTQSVHPRQFALQCAGLLLSLYGRALQLTDTTPELPGAPDAISEAEFQPVMQNVGAKLDRDYYWCIFEPWVPDPPEPVAGLLSDDLLDVWRDLKEGLYLLKQGHQADALWHWRFSFQTHWGHHAAEAIRALHGLLFGEHSLAPL